MVVLRRCLCCFIHENEKIPRKSFGGENFRSDAKAQCLFSIGSAYRTYAVASTALDASLCVDLILAVALGNSVNGALVCASAAADAIVTDLISHNTNLLLIKRDPSCSLLHEKYIISVPLLQEICSNVTII